MKKIHLIVALFIFTLLLSGCGKNPGTPANSSPANTDTIQAGPAPQNCGSDTTCADKLLSTCAPGQFLYREYQFETINQISAGCVANITRSQTGGQARCLLPLGIAGTGQLDSLITADQIQLNDRLVTGVCNPALDTI